MPNYNYWQAALAGEKPRAIVEQCELGFYRMGVYQRDGKGNNKRIGWRPVAVFMNGDVMTARIGSEADGRDLTGDGLGELWSFIAGNAISEGNYREVAEHGKRWWDDPAPPVVHVPGVVSNREPREITNADNNPPEVLTDKDHAAAIDSAIGAAKDLKVTTAEEAAIAAGAANVIRDRRLAAEKIAKTRVEPLQRVYEDERNKWLPLVKRAKDAEGVLRVAVSAFEVADRKRVAAEQLAALERQREIEEANQRAADRAIAKGEAELSPPVIDEVVIPHMPERIHPTYGTYKPKAAELKRFAVIENDGDVYQHFRNDAELIALLQKLATNAIRAGLTVPGASYREGMI